MKRVRIPKIKVGKINTKGIFGYISVILLTSLILITILISLPLTETVSDNVVYDLKTKNDAYWAEEYILDLGEAQPWVVDDVKSVLYKRLHKLGVEKVFMNSYIQDEKQYLRIHTQSSISKMYVDEIIRSPFIVSVVTKNPEIDFDDPENPYAIYLADNYIETEFKREDFRNVYVTSLKNTSNEYSYFALFKTWPWNTKWNEFMNDNRGLEVGVSIDGFVTPVTIPSTDPLIFAVPLSVVEKKEAELMSILYNSGEIPIQYSVVNQQEVPVEDIEADYIKLTIGVMIAITTIYGYLLFIEKVNKETIMVCALTTVMTISTYIAYLKISSVPVDVSILCLEILVMVALLRMTVENTESRVIINVLVAFALLLTILFGTGYAKIFASDLLVLIILGYISEIISRFYIHKIRKLVK